jgi:hypothetical protein
MFRQALLLLLVSSASAFVTSPFGGCRALPQKVLQNQLLSEPNEVTEPVDEPVVEINGGVVAEPAVEVTEPVDEPAAVAETIAPEGITEESAGGETKEKKSSKPPAKGDKERFTAFVGNLPFSKLRIAAILVHKRITGSEHRLLLFFF